MRRGASQERTEAALEAPPVAQLAQGLCECLQDQQSGWAWPVAVRSELDSALILNEFWPQPDMSRQYSQSPGVVQAPPNAKASRLLHPDAAQRQVSVCRPPECQACPSLPPCSLTESCCSLASRRAREACSCSCCQLLHSSTACLSAAPVPPAACTPACPPRSSSFRPIAGCLPCPFRRCDA